MQSIGEILKGTARGRRTATPTTESYSGDEEKRRPTHNPAPPERCICSGTGWYRFSVDIKHPWFGRAFPCVCKLMESRGHRQTWLRSVSGLSPLLQGKTLTNFTRDRQPEAFDAAAALVSGTAPQPWLLLQGGNGTGKTHLAAAAVNALVGQGLQATYCYVPETLERLRWGYDDGTFREQWMFLRTTQVLVLDDCKEHATPWVQSQLQDLLDYRLRETAPTLMAQNLSLAELPPRIRSRLSDRLLCKIVLMQPNDYRLTGEGREPWTGKRDAR